MTLLADDPRNHRGLLAVAIVIASALALWMATTFLVRRSAEVRFDDEVAKSRAAGQLVKESDSWGPKPAQSVDGLVPLRIALRLCAQFETGTQPMLRFDVDDRIRVERAAERVEIDARAHAEAMRRTLLDPRGVVLEFVRAGADRPALWLERDFELRERDALAVEVAARALENAAIESARAGDEIAACGDVERLLRLRAALDRQPDFETYVMQQGLTARIASAVAAGIERTSAPERWMELDERVAVIDPARSVRGRLRDEIARYVELYAAGSVRWVPVYWSDRLRHAETYGWPESAIWRADRLVELRADESLAARGPQAVLASTTFEMPTDLSGCCICDPHEWGRLVVPAAREQVTLTMLRAALRARFEGASAADAFLDQHPEPFSGSRISSRSNPDGIWIAWCTSRRGVPASPEGPDAAHGDLVWPPQP